MNELMTNYKRTFYVFKDENKKFKTPEACILDFHKDFQQWCDELRNNDIFKINYKNYYSHDSAVTLAFKMLANKMYKDFEKIEYDEHRLHGTCTNGGLVKLKDCYKDRIYKMYGYDFIAEYPTNLASEELKIPIGRPKGFIHTVIPEKFELGIYRVMIVSEDKEFIKLFCFNEDHTYTDISLNFALECAKRFKISVSFMDDGEQNAFIYDKWVTDKEIFGEWYDKLYRLKMKFPKNQLLKFLFSSLWGHLMHCSEEYVKACDLDKYEQNANYEFMGFYGTGKGRRWIFHKTNELYKYNIRFKPWLASMSRVKIAKVILDGDNLKSFVRVCCDGVVFINPIDNEKFDKLKVEDKSTGYMYFKSCNRRPIIFEETQQILEMDEMNRMQDRITELSEQYKLYGKRVLGITL
jgi:hypothetical protein